MSARRSRRTVWTRRRHDFSRAARDDRALRRDAPAVVARPLGRRRAAERGGVDAREQRIHVAGGVFYLSRLSPGSVLGLPVEGES